MLIMFGCDVRERPTQDANYDTAVGAVLDASCVGCHGGEAPEAGWSAESYLSSIGCTEAGDPVTLPSDASAPLLQALERADHGDLLESDEHSLLAEWVEGGAPKGAAALHPQGWLDPRSPAWHGRAAAADDFLLLRNAKVEGACGSCHAGAPTREPGLSEPPDSAPDCTSCHQEAGGVLACGTCHGDGARAVPPRDACFFPDGPAGYAHAAHVEASALRQGVIDCGTCHPQPNPARVLSGSHADGHLDVVLQGELVGDDASYAADTRTCSVGCHTRGGARAEPVWREPGPLACGDCHGSPPASHYAGACSACHPGVNADGSGLDDASRHINGIVDLGDGGGGCGACHGDGDDPWPTQGAHPVHAGSDLSAPLPCASCHVVPESVDAEGHLDASPGAEVVFSGLATARDNDPEFDGASGGCSGVACHGAGLPDGPTASLDWRAGPAAGAVCGSCHGIGPVAPHSPSSGCQALICHGAEIAQWPDGPRITAPGRALHVNGRIDVSQP